MSLNLQKSKSKSLGYMSTQYIQIVIILPLHCALCWSWHSCVIFVFFTLKYSRVCSHLFVGAFVFISSDTTMHAPLKLLSGYWHVFHLFMTGGDDKLVKVWDYMEGAVTHIGIAHSGSITCVKVCSNNRTLISTSADGAILRWKFPHPSSS